MYCPNCGSNNQAEIKFCTRCGTNLAVVSDALSGKIAMQSTIDERKVKLLKAYYSARRSTFMGVPLFVVGVVWLSMFIFFGLADNLGPLLLIPLAMAIYGAICSFWGTSIWIDTISEIKALGYDIPDKQTVRTTQAQLAAPGAAVEIDSREYVTDPIRFPGSVIEQTTRQLEEHAHQLNPESRSKQTSQ
ncbi:MAG: zinc ribbon domain-containing protein [Blastocatellia bacterium]